jgi:hypothetical protein
MPISFGPSGPIYGDTITVLASGTRTASGSGPATPTQAYNTLRLTLSVTAASGTTPSLTVTIETSADGSTGWTTLGSAYAAQTTTATVRKVFSGADRYVRASYTITGTTPSFTFDVTGEAV